MDEGEDTLLLSFLDIVCAALGAAVILFVLFLDIGTSVPAQAVGGRFIMGDFELAPSDVDYRLEVYAPNGNRILLVREEVESASSSQQILRKFGESGTPIIFSYRSPEEDTRFISINIGEPWRGCWRFRLAYLSPKLGASYNDERVQGDVRFSWVTHKEKSFSDPSVLTPVFADETSLVTGSIPVDQSSNKCDS